MNEWERQKRKAEYLKKVYPPGTRIVLNSMGDDPRPIESGTRGTVKVNYCQMIGLEKMERSIKN